MKRFVPFIKQHKVVLTVLVLIIGIIGGILFYQNTPVNAWQSQNFPKRNLWKNDANNITYLTMTGPSGTSTLTVRAYNNNQNIGNQEKEKFVNGPRTINFSVSGQGSGPYKPSFQTGSVKTTLASEGGYKVVTFTVRWTIPAHEEYKGLTVSKPGDAGRYNVRNYAPGHSASSHTIDVTYEVNITNMGMITKAGTNTRYWGTSATITLQKVNRTVSVNGNGGNVSTGSITKVDGSAIGTLPTASRQYYTFTGWTDQNGNTVSTGSIVCPNGVTAIYANWERWTGSVGFNPRGGAGSMPDQEVYAGQATNLRANAFVREGYTFAGWATDSDSQNVVYKNGQSITMTKDGEYLDLYAVWTRDDGVFDTTQLIQDAEMFGADGELVGGEGTTFDRNRTDSRFAHIDGGKDDPAYFTKK